MARVRTQKAVAGRIDLNYHRRWHRWRVGRVLLVLGCTVAAAAWVAVASVRFDRANGRGLRLVDTIHNPGPVTAAHANIEDDCRACHDGATVDGTGSRYWLNVSDTACLNCHDGAVHHQNQKMAAAHADVAFADFALAVKDASHPGGARSASCVSCHVEHRGHDLLVGTSNQLCVHCHADISKGMETGQPRPQMRAVKFTVQDHPRFGSRLSAPAGSGGAGWIDPTNLKFGHALHARPVRNAFLAAEGKPPLAADAAAEYLATDCLACHENAASPVAVNDLSQIDPGKWSNTPPPYLAPGAATTAQPVAGDYRYMSAVSFDRHCYGCHDSSLRAPPLSSDSFEDMGIEPFAIPHQDMRVVRNYVDTAVRASFARFETDRASKLETELTAAKKALEDAKAGTAATTPTDQPAEPSTPRRRGRGADAAPVEEPTGGRGRGRGRGSDTGAPAQPPKTPAGWIHAHTASAAAAANAVLAEIDGFKDRSLAEPPVDSTTDLATLVDYYASYIAAKQCYACHGMTGDLPTADAAKNAAAWKTGNAFGTAATGIPDQPRRWFPTSTFDHFAHRGVDCRGCHAPAWTSGPKDNGAYKTATAHVLTSDIDGAYPGMPGAASSAQSCVSCHHAGGVRAATDSCVSCHWYHDQKLARPMTGPHVVTGSR